MRDGSPRARAYDTVVDVNTDDPSGEEHGRAMRERLIERGFVFRCDPMTRDLSTLRDKRWLGCKRDLEAFIEIAPRQSSVVFFQSVNVSNPNGGRYDYDKFERMPRTMQLQCAVEMAAVFRVLLERGCKPGAFDHRWPASDYDLDRLELSMLRMADGRTEQEESPLASFNRGWGADRFTRGDTGWPSEQQCLGWPTKDRDGKLLRAGDVKYFRSQYPDGGKGAGYLMRAQVFPGVNGEWFPVCNGVAVARHLHAKDFFDCEHPEREPRRVVPHQPERLERELAAALKTKTYGRVATIAEVLARGAAA